MVDKPTFPTLGKPEISGVDPFKGTVKIEFALDPDLDDLMWNPMYERLDRMPGVELFKDAVLLTVDLAIAGADLQERVFEVRSAVGDVADRLDSRWKEAQRQLKMIEGILERE